MNDGVAGVAGHEQHREIGPGFLGFAGEIAPAHAGQHDVRQQKIDPGSRPPQKAEAGFRVLCREHAVIEIAKGVDEVGAHVLVVFDDEDRFASLSLRRLVEVLHLVQQTLALEPRQVDFHRRAVTGSL